MLRLILNIKTSELNDPLHKAREIEGILSVVRIVEPNEIQCVLNPIQQSYNMSMTRQNKAYKSIKESQWWTRSNIIKKIFLCQKRTADHITYNS